MNVSFSTCWTPFGFNDPSCPTFGVHLSQVNWTDTYGQHAAIQITWLSRSSTIYELQLSTDNTTWTTVGSPITGNNGPIILNQPLTALNISYRLAWRPNPDKQLIVEPARFS